jgi:hypothetical protein
MNWPQHLLKQLAMAANEKVRAESPRVTPWATKTEEMRKRYYTFARAVLEEAQRLGLVVFTGPLRAAEEEAEKLAMSQTPPTEPAESEKEAMLAFFKGK